MELLGSLLVSLFSSILSYGISKNERDLQYQRQNELLDKQNAYNTEMWDKTTEYNSEESRLERLMGVGASGGGALSMLGNNSASSIGSASPGSVAGLDSSLSNIFGDMGNKVLELENLKADTRVKNAEANRNETTLYYDINKTKAETEKLAKEMEMTDEQIKNWQIINKYADMKSQEDIRQIQTNIKLVEQQTRNASQEEKKQLWENFYRENFGIDVHDDVMKQIVSSSLKGDMDKVFNAFEKTANFVFDKLGNYAKQGYQFISNKINDLGIPTDANGIPIIKNSKYVNSKPSLINIFGQKDNGIHFRNPKYSPYYKMDKELRKNGKGSSQW